MRLAGLLMVPIVSVAVSTAGLYLAAPVGADCRAQNGSMVCTDQPAESSTGSVGLPPANYSYPCIVGLTCTGTFESELVTGN